MAFATNFEAEIYRQQQKARKDHEMYKALHEGKIVAVPLENPIASFYSDGSTPSQPTMHDEIRYNHNLMTYETRSQANRIHELERALATKELEKTTEKESEKTKLENLIAYYYNR